MREERASGPSIVGLTLVELQAQLAFWGEPRFRAKQIWNWVYRQFAMDFDEMTTLPRALRARLSALYRLWPLTPVHESVSQDGLSRKVLFCLGDGETIESVLMAYDRRQTVCVSSQVGCPVGCAFCATGHSGFTRHLDVAEIVAQPLYFARQLQDQQQRLGQLLHVASRHPTFAQGNVIDNVHPGGRVRAIRFGVLCARRVSFSENII